jgi:hypothetical protein
MRTQCSRNWEKDSKSVQIYLTKQEMHINQNREAHLELCILDPSQFIFPFNPTGSHMHTTVYILKK